MTVLGMFLSADKWTLAFEATPEEKAEALRVLGTPYKVVANAAVCIFKQPDGTFCARSGGSYVGELRGATLGDLAVCGQERLWFRAPSR